ncbi:MAG: helix-turn-helix transcriptional regulator [Nitratireductor sp.]|nr:helix-turn-helix transcriptional regulator [Nitratireductor sp.]
MSELEKAILDGIKRGMNLAHWNLRQLSVAAGVPYRSLQNYMSGRTRMPADVLLKICSELRIDLDYLLDDKIRPDKWSLWQSLLDVFGDNIEKLEPGDAIEKDHESASYFDKLSAASHLADQISIAYERRRIERVIELKEEREALSDVATRREVKPRSRKTR